MGLFGVRMWEGGKGKRKAMRVMGELEEYELRKEADVGRREREEEGNEDCIQRQLVGLEGETESESGSESGVRWQCNSRHC